MKPESQVCVPAPSFTAVWPCTSLPAFGKLVPSPGKNKAALAELWQGTKAQSADTRRLEPIRRLFIHTNWFPLNLLLKLIFLVLFWVFVICRVCFWVLIIFSLSLRWKNPLISFPLYLLSWCKFPFRLLLLSSVDFPLIFLSNKHHYSSRQPLSFTWFPWFLCSEHLSQALISQAHLRCFLILVQPHFASSYFLSPKIYQNVPKRELKLTVKEKVGWRLFSCHRSQWFLFLFSISWDLA